ncbi:anaphase-promoting complex subunit 7-like isoform X3 [Dermacentor silvarum]|uniref:anaphase-promoting complex subunit 7-like isoform X3 n=1 Tax=Dermacentor silvarum TaxID=543639 RepID=UPI0021016EF3|nr:anaphase-promoting complex subunit 7-like isoform X3 [Dermacentor silvarum]
MSSSAATSFIDQLKLLYDNKLYSNVTALFSLAHPISTDRPDLMTVSAKFQSYVYCGDAYVQLEDFKRAEAFYQKAIQLKKSAAKAKGKGPTSIISGDVTSGNGIMYQIHVCHVNMNQPADAISALESIPGKQRNSRVNMALGQLYQQSGNERLAITCYREVLKECPLALQAAKSLLELGVKAEQVAALVLHPGGSSGSSLPPDMEWLGQWIKANAYLHSREYSSSVTNFKQLEARPQLAENVEILASLGEAYYHMGDYTSATTTMERVHSLDPHLLRGMDVYAALLAKEKKVKELQSLSSQLMSVNSRSPEPWIVMAYLCYVIKKGNRAIYFAQKACTLNPRHVEALLLKGTVLLELHRVPEAIAHFGEVFKVTPYRHEAYKGMVDCYLAQLWNDDAAAIASNACKHLGDTPRVLTLYASVLMKSPESLEKAKVCLEKALKQEPTHLPAVYLLAEIYDQQRAYDRGIQLLQKHLESQSTCRLNQMLGDFYDRTGEQNKALQHFDVALNLDPSNASARRGKRRVEQ